jgi:hypothetical protein
MRHVVDLLLRVVDGRDNGRGKLLEEVGEAVLLWRCLASAGTTLGLCRDAAVRVEAAQRAVALVEDAAALFDERLDVVDQLFLVELVLGGAVGGFDVLDRLLVTLETSGCVEEGGLRR